jgi:hypothetical protein
MIGGVWAREPGRHSGTRAWAGGAKRTEQDDFVMFIKTLFSQIWDERSRAPLQPLHLLGLFLVQSPRSKVQSQGMGRPGERFLGRRAGGLERAVGLAVSDRREDKRWPDLNGL